MQIDHGVPAPKSASHLGEAVAVEVVDVRGAAVITEAQVEAAKQGTGCSLEDDELTGRDEDDLGDPIEGVLWTRRSFGVSPEDVRYGAKAVRRALERVVLNARVPVLDELTATE